jgi:hypothetical protein
MDGDRMGNMEDGCIRLIKMLHFLMGICFKGSSYLGIKMHVRSHVEM